MKCEVRSTLHYLHTRTIIEFVFLFPFFFLREKIIFMASDRAKRHQRFDVFVGRYLYYAGLLLHHPSSHCFCFFLSTHLLCVCLLTVSHPPLYAGTRKQQGQENGNNSENRTAHSLIIRAPSCTHKAVIKKTTQPMKKTTRLSSSPPLPPPLLLQSPSFLGQRYSLMASHFREQLGLIIRQTNELKNESMQTERARP